ARLLKSPKPCPYWRLGGSARRPGAACVFFCVRRVSSEPVWYHSRSKGILAGKREVHSMMARETLWVGRDYDVEFIGRGKRNGETVRVHDRFPVMLRRITRDDAGVCARIVDNASRQVAAEYRSFDGKLLLPLLAPDNSRIS